MKYSDKLNGFWEEGYHYYIEIRDGRMTVLDYHRRPELETAISYDAASLEKGEPTEISLENGVLSKTWDGEPMTVIRKLTYAEGRLEMDYYYTIMGQHTYVLNKVSHGPFAHLEILDGELLPKLKGKWYMWSRDGETDTYLDFKNNVMTFASGRSKEMQERIHVIREGGKKGRIYVTPEKLCERTFGPFSEIEYRNNMLCTYQHVCDATVPMTVFMRKSDLGKIPVPPEALREMRSTMLPEMPRVFGPAPEIREGDAK